MEEMQQFAATVQELLPPINDPRRSYYSLQHWYPRIWDKLGRDTDGAVPRDFYSSEHEHDLDDSTSGAVSIKDAIPNFADEFGFSRKVVCANEISIFTYGATEYAADVLPKPAGQEVLRAVGGPASFVGDWRINDNGLVKLVGYRSRQFIKIPKAEDVIFAWLSDLSWKPQPSPPGLLAKQILRQLDGQVCGLRNEALLGLLEHMNGGSVHRDGQPSNTHSTQPACIVTSR